MSDLLWHIRRAAWDALWRHEREAGTSALSLGQISSKTGYSAHLVRRACEHDWFDRHQGGVAIARTGGFDPTTAAHAATDVETT